MPYLSGTSFYTASLDTVGHISAVCHGAISEGCQVKALNWLLRVVTTKTLDEEEKEKKQNN